jgi:hypothetical protein
MPCKPGGKHTPPALDSVTETRAVLTCSGSKAAMCMINWSHAQSDHLLLHVMQVHILPCFLSHNNVLRPTIRPVVLMNGGALDTEWHVHDLPRCRLIWELNKTPLGICSTGFSYRQQPRGTSRSLRYRGTCHILPTGDHHAGETYTDSQRYASHARRHSDVTDQRPEVNRASHQRGVYMQACCVRGTAV